MFPLGDLVAHDIESDNVSGTILERILLSINLTSQAIGKAFPSIPLLPVLGNHDLPSDNALPKNKTFYKSILDIWKPLVICSACKTKVALEQELEQTVLNGGYYKAEVRDMLFLQLNSNYWSVNSLAKDPSASIYQTADEQMAWLEKQLKSGMATGKKAIISGHIPPG